MAVDIVVPSEIDVCGLATATKALVASVLSKQELKFLIDNEAKHPVIRCDDGSTLDDASAIVCNLVGVPAIDPKILDFERKELASLVAAGEKVSSGVAAKLCDFLPQADLTAESAVLFGDLHALVFARGKTAISAELPVVLWYQKILSNPRVKPALAPLSRLQLKDHSKTSSGTVNDTPFSQKGSGEPNESAVKSLCIENATESSASTPKEVTVSGVAASPAEKESERAHKNESSTNTTASAMKEAKPEKAQAAKVAHKDPHRNLDESVKQPEIEHPILPKDGEKNILITSALPYVNNVPHLGNIIGSVLSADFFARYCKARRLNTLFVCGTDEYGTATEIKALEQKMTPLDLCTHYFNIHKEIYDWFEIGFDHFGRTSTPQQTEIAQDIFLHLHKNGYLEEQSQTQLYCTEHEGYLADRFVEGTCPKCGFDDARGDQCDGCGSLLNPFELINPHCKLDGSKPVERETKHMFLLLDKLQPQLEKWLETRIGNWSNGARQITRAWIESDLHPRAVTRDLKWGTPVPLPGYENKVLYVWFDAPIGYVSITATYTDKWEQWWRPPVAEKHDISLYQFMGKDNVQFHAVIFPSSEIGTGQKWTTVDQLCTTDWLQYEGGKFSKSRNLGVFGNDVQDIGIPPAVWRYYLATTRPESADSQFSWRDFVARNNNELLANLGNFVNRVVKFAIARYGGEIPDFEPAEELVKDGNEILSLYIKTMDAVRLREGIEVVMRFSARGNQFLQENKLDNSLFLEHPERCASVIGTAINYIYVLSALVSPYMPTTTKQICEQLDAPVRSIPDEIDFPLKPGHVIGKAQYLFTRIDDKKLNEWQAKYGQSQSAKQEDSSATSKKNKKKNNKNKKSNK